MSGPLSSMKRKPPTIKENEEKHLAKQISTEVKGHENYLCFELIFPFIKLL